MSSSTQPPIAHPSIFLRPTYATIPCTTVIERSFPPSPHLPSFVDIRHPGYPDAHNLMISLPALDREVTQDSNSGYRWGIHYATALHACSIIACNLDGFLSPVRLSSPLRTSHPAFHPDSVLIAPIYYFYPSSWTPSDIPYPVCPDFTNWCFPHGSLPDVWKSSYPSRQILRPIPAPSQFSRAVANRDGSCRISDFSECLETAHLIPQKEQNWFLRNEMRVYNANRNLSGKYLTCDINNCFLVRQDLHTVLNSKSFVFVPKGGSSYIHFLTVGPNYAPLYHNCMTELLDLSTEFLYARFAWAIFPMIGNFVSFPGVRIKVYNPETMDWEIATVEEASHRDTASQTPRHRRRRGLGDSPSVSSSSIADSGGSHEEVEISSDIVTSASYSASSGYTNSYPPDLVQPPPKDQIHSIFHTLVEKDADRAWDTLHWHPDAERIDHLKESYLSENEPLHQQELLRQRVALDEEGVLWD